MLMVLFQLGAERYALGCHCVIEIVPQVALTALPHAPAFVAGLLNYRSTVVPVIDLSQLTQKRPCQPYLSTRIILIHYRRGQNLGAATDTESHVLGLLAERVTGVREQPQLLSAPPVRLAAAPYLDKIYTLDGELLQGLEPAALLSAEVQDLLFAQRTA